MIKRYLERFILEDLKDKMVQEEQNGLRSGCSNLD